MYSHDLLPLPATLQGHQRAVRSCAFSPNGKLLLTSSADSTAILWEVATQRVLATYKRGDSGWVGHCVTGGRGG